jgi:predicted amidophosphoribosyltransferase
VNKLYKYNESHICIDCLEKKSEAGNTCPVCGTKTSVHDEVSLMLTRPKATEKEKAIAPEVPVIICPSCKILYFDEYTYQVIKSLQS